MLVNFKKTGNLVLRACLLRRGQARGKLLLAAVIALISSQAYAEVKVSSEHKLYVVRADQHADLVTALSQSGPQQQGKVREYGQVFTDYNWRTWYLQKDEQCQVSTQLVSLKLEYLQPQLQTKSKTLEQFWLNWYPALDKHMAGHARIARKYAEQLDLAIAMLGKRSSCAILDADIAYLLERTLEEAKAAQAKYDQDTQFGQQQGAWLTLPVKAVETAPAEQPISQ